MPDPRDNESKSVFQRLLKGEPVSAMLGDGVEVGCRKAKGIFDRLLAGEAITAVRKDHLRPLYVSRPVANADEIISWAKAQGFETTLPAEDMHVTLAYSKRPLDWSELPPPLMGATEVPVGGLRDVMPLGDEGAIVLRFDSDELTARWKELTDAGASWDYDGFRPHVTITYKGGDVDPEQVEPFQGTITLGPEAWEEISGQWQDNLVEKSRFRMRIQKLHEEQQIAYGWATVIEEGDREVVDHDDDIITEDELVQFAHKFLLEGCGGKVMHEGARVSDLVESAVITKDMQEALGIDLGKVGWWVGFKYHDAEAWAKIKSGELPMFSIGFDARRRKRG